MKRLIIVGAGGFGREVHAWARQHPDCGKIWEIAGFLDDDVNALASFSGRGELLGTIDGYEIGADDLFVCAIGSPLAKRLVVEKLESRGGPFFSLIHPSVIVGDSIQIGRGVVLCPGTILTSDITVGPFVALNCFSSVGHDVVIGAYATISGHCDLMGGVSLGEGSFLGSGVRIIPGKCVGAGAYVGAGSVVISSVKEGARVFGNPAVRMN